MPTALTSKALQRSRRIRAARRRPLKARRLATRSYVLSEAEIARINGAQESLPELP